MGIGYDDLLLHAEEQLDQDSEINFRDSISRSYYASYHACKSYSSLIQRHGVTDADSKQSTGMHRKFINSFLTNPAPEVKKVGYILQNIYAERIRADYILDEDITLAQTETALKLSKKAIKLISEL